MRLPTLPVPLSVPVAPTTTEAFGIALFRLKTLSTLTVPAKFELPEKLQFESASSARLEKPENCVPLPSFDRSKVAAVVPPSCRMLLPLPTTLPLNVPLPASIASTSLVPPNCTAVPLVPVMVPLLTSVVVPPEVVTPVTPVIAALLPAVMNTLPAVERDVPMPTPVLCTPASTSILMSPVPPRWAKMP